MRYVGYTLFSIIITFISFYFYQPTLNYGFTGFPFLLLLISGFIFLIENIIEKGAANQQSRKKIRKKSPIKIPALIACILSGFYVIIFPILTSAPIFHSDAYRDLIGEVQTNISFEDHVAPISTEEIRIVDRKMAYRLGDKVLGSVPSLGSQVNLGNFTIQKVKDKLYWVAPLLHSGFFKWNKNPEGTIGYVMVSATNDRDVTLVQEYDGQPVRIKYQPKAYFTSNLKRHIYYSGYMSKGFTDYTFEINDEGKPFWVVTLYDKTIGFGGKNATGVITVDVATGAIEEYPIDKTPAWIDRVQPEDFIWEQLNDWGEYINGYWNFANEGKLMTTDGMTLVYGTNNRSYWYTGLTSVGSDEGTVGFVLVDTRSKEAFWFRQVGATEKAAQYSAMGKVQEKGYGASFPITYNINGIPTYVISLTDRAGLVKMIGMVSVEDFTIVGVGNTMSESLRAYKGALNGMGNNMTPSSQSDLTQLEAEVMRIASDIRNGNTLYYLILKDHEHKIFVGSSLISNEFPITEKGDRVKLKYDEDKNEVVDIITFDNQTFDLK